MDVDPRPLHLIFGANDRIGRHVRPDTKYERLMARIEDDPDAFVKSVMVKAVLLEMDEAKPLTYHPQKVIEGISIAIDVASGLGAELRSSAK